MHLLIIEPFVFIRKKGDELLFYNTLDGCKVISKSRKIVDIIESNNNMLYVFEIGSLLFKDSEFKKFVTDLEKNNLGYVIKKKGRINPIQFSPFLNLQCEKLNSMNSVENKDNCLKNLIELKIYLNGNINSCNPFYKKAYKQFPCNQSVDSNELLKDYLHNFTFPALDKGSSLISICFLGGNVFEYSEFAWLVGSFIPKLYTSKIQLKFYLNINDIRKHQAQFCLLKASKVKFILTCIDDNELKELDSLLTERLINIDQIEIRYIIDKEIDTTFVDNMFEQKGISKYHYLPYYNADNISLFYNNVFLDASDIESINIDQNEIFKNIKINSNDFGKLTIMNDGNVYSNVNKPSLGSIYNNNIYEIIYKELQSRAGWFNVREQVEPCKNCIYDFLCPPISNYEYVIGKHNFCKITD